MDIGKPMKALVICSFVFMIAVNALAEVLPLGGMNTGQISGLYPNLITPAAYTFTIWGVIYLLLFFHVLSVMGLFRQTAYSPETMKSVELLFSISSLVNAGWMVAWHANLMGVALLLMVTLLVLLAVIIRKLDPIQGSLKERLLVRVPFSIYLGWITVATIANATVLFVSLGFTGSPAPDLWAVGILVIGLAIGVLTIVREVDIAYGLVFFWAYAGILVRHLSSSGYAGSYLDVVMVLCASLAVIAVSLVFVISKRRLMESSKASIQRN